MIKKTSQNTVVIGAGYWGKNIIKNLQELGAFYAYVDEFIDLPHLKKISFNEALLNPEISSVMIATPSNTHGDIIRQCLAHGKHVFVEKPLCLSLSEADELSDFAKKQQCIFMVGYLMIFHPVTPMLTSLMQSEALQACHSILIQRQTWIAPRNFESIWWDLCVHDISMLHSIFGQVPQHEKIQMHQTTGNGCDTLYYQGSLTHPLGHTVTIHLSASWLSPIKGTYWTLCTPDTLWTHHGKREFELHSQSIHDHTTPAKILSLETQYPLRSECQHFLSCVEEQLEPISAHSRTRPVMQWLDSLEKIYASQNKKS